VKYSLGRYVYGLAVIAFGVCALAWHDLSNWLQLKATADLAHSAIVTSVVAVIEILGGVAVLFPRTARAGAIILGSLYFIFALLTTPFIIKQPLVYNSYGNFFEQFSFVAGAMILYALSGPTAPTRTAKLAQFGYYAFGVCVLSFGLEQLFYLAPTASLVPKWIPPGQMFWAIATTVAFVLAAISLVTGFMARLAARLTTAMLIGFGLLVWVPVLLTTPHDFFSWTEIVETFGIAGSAWMVAKYLGQRRASEAAEA
jgi:uncharacterized membrane protein YphA (DoxX/SURF4 family)